MNEPTRMVDDPGELGLSRDAVEALNGAPVPTIDVDAAVARFESTIGAGAAAPAASSSVGLIAGAGVVLVVGAVGAWLWLGPPGARAAPEPAAATLVETASSLEVRPAHVEPVAPPVLARTPADPLSQVSQVSQGVANPKPKTPPTRAGAEDDDALRREMVQLNRARKLLRTDPKQALALVDAGEREFRKSMFREERQAISILALAKLGRDVDAQKRAKAFLLRFPKGRFNASIRDAVGEGEKK